MSVIDASFRTDLRVEDMQMAFRSWTESVSSLEKACESVTSKQLVLARIAAVEIEADTPSIVAAAMLRVALHEDLYLPPTSPPKEYVAEALAEIKKNKKLRSDPADNAEAAAWLTYFRYQQRAKHLRDLKINAGDIVRLSDDELMEVSSIDELGRVFFKGGRGAQAWPDVIISVAVRAGDSSQTSMEARKKAENAAVVRSATARWSSVKSDDLQEFAITEHATDEQIDELESVIMAAADERPIQRYLEANGCLLTTLLGGMERFFIPQKRLGAEYVPDFIIGDVDSLGIRWVLVELETPKSGIYLGNGKSLDQYARKGVGQINEWRKWLQENIAYAQKPRRKDGLGLSDINGLSDAYVLVGRRAKRPETKDAERAELRRLGTHVHSYDWLLERLRGAIRFSGPPASNPDLIGRPDATDDAWSRRR